MVGCQLWCGVLRFWCCVHMWCCVCMWCCVSLFLHVSFSFFFFSSLLYLLFYLLFHLLSLSLSLSFHCAHRDDMNQASVSTNQERPCRTTRCLQLPFGTHKTNNETHTQTQRNQTPLRLRLPAQTTKNQITTRRQASIKRTTVGQRTHTVHRP